MGFAELLAAADRAALQILGGPVRYEPRTQPGEPVDVRGVFDAAYLHADANGAGMVSAGPSVFLRLADLPTDPEEDDPAITVAGVEYRVREPQKDGLGGVLLLLREAQR